MIQRNTRNAGCEVFTRRRNAVSGLNHQWIVLFVSGCLLLLTAMWSGIAAAAPGADVEKVIRQALQNSPIDASSIAEEPLSAAKVRDIVFDNLDSRLNHACSGMWGKTFRFVPAGQDKETAVVILLLDYFDPKITSSMSRRLEAIGGALRETKVLTPFSYAVVGRQLIIMFTESSDERIVRLVRGLPGALR